MNEWEYLWDHFKFNAEQRLKAFNFFVLLSIFANGGVFTAIEKNFHPLIILFLGVFIIGLSVVFLLVDLRSQHLLGLTTPGLKQLEKAFPEHSRLFEIDSKRRFKIVRYSVAFHSLIVFQLLFGLGVLLFSGASIACSIKIS